MIYMIYIHHQLTILLGQLSPCLAAYSVQMARHDLLKLFKTAAGSPQDALQRMVVSGAPSEAEWTSALQEGDTRTGVGGFSKGKTRKMWKNYEKPMIQR